MTEQAEILDRLKAIEEKADMILEFVVGIILMSPEMAQHLRQRSAAQPQEKTGCEGCGDTT